MSSDQIKKTKSALAFFGYGKTVKKVVKQLAMNEAHLVDAPVGTVSRWSDGHLYRKELVGWTLLPQSSNPPINGPDTPPKGEMGKAGPGENDRTQPDHTGTTTTQDVMHKDAAPLPPKHDFPHGPAYVSNRNGKYHVMAQDAMGVYHSHSEHDTESAANSTCRTHVDHNGRQAQPNFAHAMIRFEKNLKPGHEVHLKMNGVDARAQVSKVNDSSVKARLMHAVHTDTATMAPGHEVSVPRAASTLRDPTSKWHASNGVFPLSDETPKSDGEAMAAIMQSKTANGSAKDYSINDLIDVHHPNGESHSMLVDKVDKRYNRISVRPALPGEGKYGYTLDMAGFAGRINKKASAPVPVPAKLRR